MASPTDVRAVKQTIGEFKKSLGAILEGREHVETDVVKAISEFEGEIKGIMAENDGEVKFSNLLFQRKLFSV